MAGLPGRQGDQFCPGVQVSPVERHADQRMDDQVPAVLHRGGGGVTGDGEHALERGPIRTSRRAERVQVDHAVQRRGPATGLALRRP